MTPALKTFFANGGHLSLGSEGHPVEKPQDLMGKHEILLRAAHDNDPFAVARLHRQRESLLYGYNPSTDR